MSTPLDPPGSPAPRSEADLARLDVQVEAMRAVLVRLLQEVVVAERQLELADASRVVAVNERLVVAAMTSQADAESAAMALRDAQASATLDPLTRLHTRSAMTAQFLRHVADARRDGSRLAILFLDLDDFKRLNDTHGHGFGDKLLSLAATRMLAAVRECDMVSRHGGDEFVVLLAHLAEPSDAQAAAEKLIATIGTPAEIDGRRVNVTASVGIALYPDDGEDLGTLIRQADAAMYQAKNRAAGSIAFHGSRPVAGVAAGALSPGAGVPSDLERRHAMLRDANEQLVLAAISAQELKDAAEQARQRQTAFVAAVADELRNPIAPIRIAAAMLGRPSASEPLLPQVQRIVEEQLTHVSRLVGKLVDASAGPGNGLRLDLQQVDMAHVIDECIGAHRPTMEAHGQHFESHRPAGALPVLGDAHRLVQVLGNLLDNASRHTRDGGRISLSTVASTDTLTMTVSDNGIGITPQMLPRIFEPFAQDVHAIGFHGVGLGIGLTVVRALVREHGGDLAARSAGVGRGSQFTVTLPLAPGP